MFPLAYPVLMLVGATAMAVFEYSLGRADGHRSPEVDGVSEDRSRMAEAILSGLPVTTFGQAGAGARCGEACAVCLGAFEPDSRIRVTACGHVFCNECLERQLHHTPGASWSQCSLCRRSLST